MAICFFPRVYKTKNPNSEMESGLMWCHQESNRGHKDFQSFALPSELWHHYFLFAVAKVDIFFYPANF